jgi:hypothetical protein
MEYVDLGGNELIHGLGGNATFRNGLHVRIYLNLRVDLEMPGTREQLFGSCRPPVMAYVYL